MTPADRRRIRIASRAMRDAEAQRGAVTRLDRERATEAVEAARDWLAAEQEQGAEDMDRTATEPRWLAILRTGQLGAWSLRRLLERDGPEWDRLELADEPTDAEIVDAITSDLRARGLAAERLPGGAIRLREL